MTRSSNTIDDAIYGLTLNLHNTTDANGEKISLTRDIESISSKMTKLVEAYNSTITFIKENTAYDADNKVAGVLMGDYLVSTIRNQILSPILNHSSGFISGKDTFLNPTEIGLEIDRDGKLSLDSKLFSEAVTKDYRGVLELIGADKTGSSNSEIIKFYGASSRYTSAGNYNVKIQYDSSGNHSQVWIKLTTESEYRQATIDEDGYIIGNSEFSDRSEPLYAENGLQLTAPTTGVPGSELTAVINVKQGFTGNMEDVLDRMLRYNGSITINKNHINDEIKLLQDKIDQEQVRLNSWESRIRAKYARLESILSSFQCQLAALGLS
jgi:flagellar hook-associated protein 2